MPKIVILDAATTNPGDLSWEEFNELGSVSIFPRTADGEILTRCDDAEIVLSNKVRLNHQHFEKLPALKYVGVLASGVNNIDLEAAKFHRIAVTNVPSYSGQSVAQLILAMILNHSNHVQEHSSSVRKGDWSRSPDFSYTVAPISELAGKTLGIYGYGDIGTRLAQMVLPLGMNVLIYKRDTTQPLNAGLKYATAEDIFKRSDFLSLNCPLTETTLNLINENTLSMMKASAVIINTGRGQLIDEQALANSLRKKTISAAYLDVLSQEPPALDHPLIGAPNCRITPHIGWATPEARARLLKTSLSNLKAFLNSESLNRIV